MAPLVIVEANPPKFDAAFLNRRMREHREWQKQVTAEVFSEAVLEVARALDYVRKVRIARAKKLRGNL